MVRSARGHLGAKLHTHTASQVEGQAMTGRKSGDDDSDSDMTMWWSESSGDEGVEFDMTDRSEEICVGQAFDACRDAHEVHDNLFEKVKKTEIPFVDMGQRLAVLGPRKTHELRVQNRKRLERVTEELREADARLEAELDPVVRQVLRAAGDEGPHLAFLEWSMRESGYQHSQEVIEHLSRGFPLTGKVPVEGSAKPRLIQTRSVKIADLARGEAAWRSAREKNKAMARNNDNEVNAEIMDQTKAEQKLGRMGPFLELGTENIVPTRRFGVQQRTSDGRNKVRCIDDCKDSKINGLATIVGRIRMGRLADIERIAKVMHNKYPQEQVLLWKGDFKSAYRGLPVRPEDRELMRVMVYDPETNESKVLDQYALPFGAIQAVYAWDRVAAAITHIVRYFAVAPCSRYVDDLFGVTWSHGHEFMTDFVKWLVMKLGFRLAEDKTPPASEVMVILGVRVEVVYKHIRRPRLYFKVRVDDAKAKYWVEAITDMLQARSVDPKLAEIFAGRLNFVATAVAGRAGSCRLSELYKAAHINQCYWSSRLQEDLQWWVGYMKSETSVLRPVCRHFANKVSIFSDAAGSGGIGAVIFVNDRPPVSFRGHMGRNFTRLFKHRKTQIMALEMAAVVVSLLRCRSDLRGARVVFYIDNRPGLFSFKKGRAKCDDHNKLVRIFADEVAAPGISCLFQWVPSKWNIADWPSRGQDVTSVKRCIVSTISDLVDRLNQA